MKVKEVNIVFESEKEYDRKIHKKLREFDKGIFPKKDVKTEISFENIEHFRKFLTPKRLELLHFIKHKKPASIYELAKDIGRDRKAVTVDIKSLSDLGFIELKEEKKVREVVRPIIHFDKLKIGIII